MSHSGNDLVIIYEEEAEQWATYLKYVFIEKINVQNMCCYDIGMVSIKNDDFLKFSLYKCKLLILSKGMLETMCQIRRFFLSRVLQPPQTVVILQCGVESSSKLFDLVPLGSECLEISSEQDPQEYLAIVTGIIYKGAQAATNVNARTAELEFKVEKKHSVGALPVKSSILVIPTRIPCEKPEDIFLLLRDALNPKDIEIEFQANNQKVKVKPTPWNEKILCVKALDFPAGTINVNIYCGGVITTKTELQYYTAMGEIEHLLKKAADPIEFMCQAFQISSTDKLDQLLTSSLKDRMPAGGLGVLQIDGSNKSIQHSDELPTLLHFAAKNGLKNLAALLLQCPGAQQAARMTNKHRESPVTLAEKHGHTDLQKLIEEILKEASSTTDEEIDEDCVYELMESALKVCPSNERKEVLNLQREEEKEEEEELEEEEEEEEEEDPYALVGINDEVYDMILSSNKEANETRKTRGASIINRPPAPTPRPAATAKEDSTPFIAQVFQQKADSGPLYSLPERQVKGRDSVTSMYDTFVPRQPPGLEELIQLQEKVKSGSISMDEALDKFSKWQKDQRGMDIIQQENLRQLRESIINNRAEDDSVYDKITIIHHTPDMNEGRRGSKNVDEGFYSKPLKGQQPPVPWKPAK